MKLTPEQRLLRTVFGEDNLGPLMRLSVALNDVGKAADELIHADRLDDQQRLMVANIRQTAKVLSRSLVASSEAPDE